MNWCTLFLYSPINPLSGKKFLTVTVVIIGIVLVCALGIRLFFYVGMGPRDDIAYLGVAQEIQTHSYSLPHPESFNIFAVRMMVYLPVLFSWTLFGMSEFSTSSYFIFCSLLMIIIGYGMARVCYGPVEGVMVTIILSLLPLDIVFSSQVMPDLPQSVLGSAAILCFLVGQKKENKFYFIISGILLSLSIMTKEFACIYAIILLFFVGHAIITGVHTPTKALAALAITIGSSMVVLFLFWLPYLVEKIPWAPFKVVMNNATAEKNDNPDRWFYFKLMFNLYQHPWSTRYFGIFYYFVGIALVYLAIGDFPKSSVIGLWLLFYLSFIQWVGPWLAERASCERMERFLIPLGLPASLILTRSLGLLWRFNRFTKIAVVIIMICLSYSFLNTTKDYAYPSESIHLWDLKQVAHLLPKLTPYPFYADMGSADKLRFLTSYSMDIRDYLPNRRDFKTFSRCWVALDLSDEAFLKGWIRLRAIPETWVEVFQIRGPHFAHFTRYDAKIFWVP